MRHATDELGQRTAVSVLVADDDAGVRELLASIFDEAGYQVHAVADGMLALSELQASADHLIALLDWRMPGLTGCDVIEACAAEPTLIQRHAYILLSASLQACPLKREQLPINMNVSTMPKPFDIDLLLSVVERAASALQGVAPYMQK